MSKISALSAASDKEERDLATLIESEAYVPGASQLTAERVNMLKAAAQVKQDSLARAKILLRLPKAVLERLKEKAKKPRKKKVKTADKRYA